MTVALLAARKAANSSGSTVVTWVDCGSTAGAAADATAAEVVGCVFVAGAADVRPKRTMGTRRVS